MRQEKKKFTYRGKELEELKKMDIREFAKHLKSRQRRYVMRNFDTIERFIKKCKRCEEREKPIRTHSREIIIVPEMVGMTIHVYNGQKFIPIKVVAEMIGHRLGEFSHTRAEIKHGVPGIGATRGSAALSVK